MGNPVAIVVVVGAYLIFVLRVGPQLMANRKPMDLTYTMIAYNLLQVVLNTYLVLKLIRHKTAMDYLFNHTCQPLEKQSNPLRLEMCSAYWQYLAMKILDLADTIFIVLRKKQGNASFLHIYHHASMVFLTWFWFKYMREEQFVVLGALNLLVHSFMYSYYLASSFGPKVKAFLWWKRYVTWIQMVQFCLGIGYLILLVVRGCRIACGSALFWATNLLFFLVLFSNFYLNTYKQNKRKTI
uniref:Elongation of very long chain fatty acids protein n=1 Tax=Nilaparvata lugens TaxID=108931 RepID=A0A3S7L478_NILLU|nr:fatty acid elongase [Nilaparvata lugens]